MWCFFKSINRSLRCDTFYFNGDMRDPWAPLSHQLLKFVNQCFGTLQRCLYSGPVCDVLPQFRIIPARLGQG